jgi:long-chain fatty acid transport protein
MKFTKQLVAAAIATVVTAPAWATNGMNMEGYGSKSTAMGGAGMAFDTGNSAVMNNPATLSMMEANTARFGIGIRNLRPDITSTAMMSTDSDGDSYFMPSLSYIRKNDNLSYGLALLAQGGMGTEYDSSAIDLNVVSGETVRSELGVGRIMAPLSFQVNDRLAIGGSLDFVMAMLDLKMAVPGAALPGLVTGGDPGWTGPGGALEMLGAMDPHWGRFDFSDGSDMTGKAKGYGLAGKLGFTYKLTDNLTVGASYHTKTNLSDLETTTGNGATMSAGFAGLPPAMTMNGKIKIRDFQWPETYGIGLAFQANDKLLLAADVKRINWSEVLESFKMTFSHSAFGDLDVALDQNWDDQTVLNLGVEYQYSPKLALRAGLNLSDNPVPNTDLNYLFPATIENHVTLGFGYAINDSNSIAFSLSHAPEVKETAGSGVTTSHAQTNWTFNYVHTFR